MGLSGQKSFNVAVGSTGNIEAFQDIEEAAERLEAGKEPVIFREEKF